MDKRGIKELIQYIEYNCRTTITSKQTEQLRKMKLLAEYNIRGLRTLYHIAVANYLYPECPYCHQSIRTQEDLTIDHIIPHAIGGTDNIENLQPMHKVCNSENGCTIPETTTCDEVPVKKHRRNHHSAKHKERDIIKSHTPDELYQKCKKIDQARTSKAHAHITKHTR